MKKTKTLTLSAILIGAGIVIPMFMPKLYLPPVSFTLASHVPVFIAMFISPAVAVSVALGTAFGFFITTTPEIALRALSHLVFAILGSMYLKKHPLKSTREFVVFNIVIGILHSVCEVLVVLPFLNISASSQWVTILLLMGFGGFVHNLVDFTLSFQIVKRLPKTMVE